jgi:hypothetical protein
MDEQARGGIDLPNGDEASPSRLASECGKLDRAEEQTLAEEGHSREDEWPDY